MNYMAFTRDTQKESSVSVVGKDGVLQYVFTEERYSRKKYDCGFPFNSIMRLSHFIDRDLLLNHEQQDKDVCRPINAYFPGIKIDEPTESYHHLLHCYESFYTSGFNRAAVLVVDGYGDNDGKDVESISLYHKIGKETKLLKRYYAKDSLGSFYYKGAYLLGFKPNEEGHFMGLASYGVPFEKRYAKFENGEFNIIDVTCEKNIERFDHNSLECINSINFAATIQRDVTECLLGLVKYIKDLTGEDNLCLSGGVFNNVLANNVICESGIFKNVWCSPAPGDYGLAVGKSYFSYEKYTPDNDIKYHKMKNAYLGEEYSDAKVLKYLKENKIEYKKTDKNEISRLLNENNVLAWFQGRSEYGRRALGHRSILSNPFYRKNYKKVSSIIKKRAPYRPLACTVPDELFSLMFDVKNKDLTEYMLRGIQVKKDIRDKVPACLAIDNTTRPQNLHRSANPELYDVIMNLYKISGIPAVVNTSLNGGGEPIVETLYDLFVFCNNQPEIEYIVINAKYIIDNQKLRNYLINNSILDLIYDD